MVCNLTTSQRKHIEHAHLAKESSGYKLKTTYFYVFLFPFFVFINLLILLIRHTGRAASRLCPLQIAQSAPGLGTDGALDLRQLDLRRFGSHAFGGLIGCFMAIWMVFFYVFF